MMSRLRIAIVGAGPAGLTTASIVCRNAPAGHFVVDIFEKGARHRPQGAGWDVDSKGQTILEKAGVDHSKISRPGSNTFRVFLMGQEEPLMVMGLPRFFSRFISRPELETSRNAMHDALLASLAGNPGAQVNFDCGVVDVRPKAGKNNEKEAELIGTEGQVLGTYDLVIDASGVTSSLRQRRVSDESDNEESSTGSDCHTSVHRRLEPSYSGLTMLHGVVDDPDACCPPNFMRRLGQGTFSMVGDRAGGVGGVWAAMQRFGAELEDHRTSFLITLARPGMNEVAVELNEKLKSSGCGERMRYSLNEMEDPKEMAVVRQWIKDTELGPAWEKEGWYHAIDALSSIAVRPIIHLPSDPPLIDDSNTLPLLCIGDALHCLPPYTGSSGNFALEDANDLADSLVAMLKKNNDDESTTTAATATTDASTTTMDIVPELRRLERVFLDRTRDTAEQGRRTQNMVLKMGEMENFTRDFSLEELMRGGKGEPATIKSRLMFLGYRLFMSVHRLDGFGMPPPPENA